MTCEPALLARNLRTQHRERKRFEAVLADGRPLSLLQGYEVQRHHVEALGREHASQVAGYKIGLTSQAMQEMCGIAHPVYGCVLESRVARGAGSVSLASHGRLGVEFEIAARLGRDLRAGDAGDPLAAAAAAVDAVAVALELIDDRNADYSRLDAASLIADNAWNAGVVLGAWTPLFPELDGWAGVLSLNGDVVDEGRVGTGSAHPLASVAWLADTLAQQGGFLARGSFVMTGSIVRTRFPAPGETWRFAAERLGGVELTVTP
jgi:2-keto-4-pentenoate hydratase